jgi:hypothetical protein
MQTAPLTAIALQDEAPRGSLRQRAAAARWTFPEVPRLVEGQRVIEDFFQPRRGGKPYTRYQVQCKFRDCKHAPHCEKKRGVGPRQTSQFGPLESWAYLGVWLQCGSQASSKKEHLEVHPTAAQVKKYLSDRGMI